MRRRAALHVIALLATGLCFISAAPEPAERAVPRTHAHNDYHHPRPLLDALGHGFVSVEADVFLVGSDLRLSHDKVEDWMKLPTLEAAYLTPLSELKTQRNSGGIYPDGTRLMLLVDLKTDGVATYQHLHEVLARYQAATPGLFTSYEKTGDGKWRVMRGAVDVIITGNANPPRQVMAQQDLRYAGHDGRAADIGPDTKPEDAPEVVPLISDNWEKVFAGELAWDGTGDMPAATRRRLIEVVDAVHAEGKLLRFWNLPKDAAAVWGPLYDCGVDLINTDDLKGLSAFLQAKQAQ